MIRVALLLLAAVVTVEGVGDIVVIGGRQANGFYMQSIEHQADTTTPWETRQSLQQERDSLGAASHDGMLYAIGGVAMLNPPSYTKTTLDSVEMLDTSDPTGVWSYGPSLQNPRQNFATVMTNAGVLWAIGGASEVDIYTSTEMLDTSDLDGEWSDGPDLQEMKLSLAGVAINGMIYAIGGSFTETLASTEILDTNNQAAGWSYGPSLQQKRNGHSVAALNGMIYAIGGYDGGYLTLTATIEILDTSNVAGGWSYGPPLQTALHSFAAQFSGDMLCVIGGYDSAVLLQGNVLTDVKMLDTKTGGWSNGLPLNSAREKHAGAVLTEKTSGGVVNKDCAGTWSCDASCTASFTQVTAQSGNGAACPTQHTCSAGDEDCPDGPTDAPTDAPDAPANEIAAPQGVLTAPMQIDGGGSYIYTPDAGVKGSSYSEPPTGGAIFYVLASTSTTVELECEVFTPSTTSDSFFVWFDNAPFYLWKTGQNPSFAWTPVGEEEGGPVRTFALSAGMHTLHIGLREDGAQMRTLRISSGDAVFTTTSTPTDDPATSTPTDGPSVQCPTLSPPAYAMGSSCTDSTKDDTCTFICGTGYQATNSQGTRTCQGDSTWGGEDLTCEAVVCPAVPLPTNAINSVSTECLNGLEGDVCSYACEIGYSDNGYESRTCSDGEWTGEHLVCTAMPCPLLQVPDGGAGELCADKIQGDTCPYTCLDGYDPSEDGLVPRQCDDGEWVGPALTCTETGNCPQLSAPVGAVAQTCTAKTIAETCTFTCDVGYEAAVSTRTCQSGLIWDGDEFQCTPLACPDLTAPANAVVASCTTKLHQDSCTFACNTGFSDNGFSSRTCEGGVWSGQDLVCAPKPCPDLSFPNNALDGSVACSGKVEPETCTFSCQAGFKTAGDATRTCEAGAWTGFTLVCTAQEYTYIASDWAACDVACGGGSQTRTLECVNVSGGNNEVVDVANCADLHAVETVQTCNAEPCVTYDWVPGDWGDCGAPCGGSEQTQAVTCGATEDGSTSASVSVAVELCTDSGAKPPTSQTCNTEPCVDNHWVLGEWAPCSAECDGGVQTRVVGCRDPKGNVLEDTECDEDTPDTEQECNTHSCSTTSYIWAICNWDACTAQCGGAGTEGGLMAGVLYRSVYCENGDGARVPSAACAEAGAEPITSSIGCNPFACEDYNWMTTAWTECTDGLRTRTRHCHGPDGSNAVDEECNPSISPGLTDTLCTPGMCSTFVDVDPADADTSDPSVLGLATATTAWPAAIIVLAATLSVFLELV